MAATKSNESRVAYIFKESTPPGNGTWHPVVGIASTLADYTWTGTHVFNDQPVTFEEVVKAQGGVNNFTDASARDAAIPSPDHGTVAFVKNIGGNIVNQIQYYSANAGAWVNYSDTSYANISSNATLELFHAGKTVNVTAAATITLPAYADVPLASGTRIDFIRTGSGDVTFATASGVTLNSKNSWLKIGSQYSGATALKVGQNAWVLVGDLKA
jgi:hypothetical protein